MHWRLAGLKMNLLRSSVIKKVEATGQQIYYWQQSTGWTATYEWQLFLPETISTAWVKCRSGSWDQAGSLITATVKGGLPVLLGQAHLTYRRRVSSCEMLMKLQAKKKDYAYDRLCFKDYFYLIGKNSLMWFSASRSKSSYSEHIAIDLVF